MPFAPGLFGTHVGGCPSNPGTLAEVLVFEGKSEVGNTRFTRVIDQDVGGLDVPVDQPSGVGVMKCLGDDGNQFRRIPERRVELCPILTARSLPSTNFETTKQSRSSVRPTSKTGTMLGWSSRARMRASLRYASTSSGASDAFRVRHFDRYGAVKIIVVGKIDPSEPTLTETADDPVTPDLRGIAVRGFARIP